ncbi:MAG: VOC family protein [Acidobacteria bacterium]|nr:VOC family protein [Acidobacteriota bacterium]
MQQSRFVWYELMTNDTAAAKEFYGKVVGWTMQDLPGPAMTYTMLNAGGVDVGGLMAFPPGVCGPDAKPAWLGYVGVDDVDAAAAQLEKLGGKVHRTPCDIPNVGRFAVVADPQGAVFYLFRPSQSGGPEPDPAPGRICWRELHASDWPAAFEFYSAMFGWQKGQAMDMGPMGTYQLFTIDGAGAGAMFNSPAAQQARFWLFYFIVEDIDAAVARVTAAGGKILMGPAPVPENRWIVQATDPQGAMFALLGTRE